MSTTLGEAQRTRRVSFLSRQSIAVKAPLSLAILLSIAFAAMTLAVYVEVRASVLSLTAARLENAARQLADLMGAGVRTRIGLLRTFVQQPMMIDYLRNPDSTAVESLTATFTKFLGASAKVASIELWDAGRTTTGESGFVAL